MSGPLQILFKDTYCVDCRRELPRGTGLSMQECPAGLVFRCANCAQNPYVPGVFAASPEETGTADFVMNAKLVELLRSYQMGADRGELKSFLDDTWGTRGNEVTQ